jgi:hypothetical protein
MFGKYDKDQDQAFSPQEVVNFFSTCPRMPWGPEVYYQVVLWNRNRNRNREPERWEL